MEKELKFALTRRGYETLLATAKGRSKHQVNVYFETRTRSLRRAGAGLRVRIEDGKRATLTLKCAVASTAKGAKQGWHERQEWECPLPLVTAKTLANGKRPLSQTRAPTLRALARHLPQIPIEDLKPIGRLQTWRCPLPIGRFQGELDRWQVGDRLFYELEVETSRRVGAEKAVARLFKSLSIPVRFRATTKLSTFFRLAKK